jgi:hypothetical protein
MIEAYAFLATFVVQLVIMSVALPAWLIRRVTRRPPGLVAERYAQLEPGFDYGRAVERFAARFRAANLAIVVVGLVLFGWFYQYTQRSDWDDGPVEALVGVYFALQSLPIVLLALAQARLKLKLLSRTTPDSKRKATLQRRGLFDFVSPVAVFAAALAYVLYAAYLLYIGQHPFPGFAGIGTNLALVSLLYAMNGFMVYRTLYGRKLNGLETGASAVQAMGTSIRACVCACIAVVVHMSINFTLVLQDMQRWEPVAASAFMVFSGLLCLFVLPAPTRSPDAEGPGPGERLAEHKP